MGSTGQTTGERLKAKLAEIDKDQGWLAGQLGVSQSAISQIITGVTQRSRLLPEIAKEIDVDLDWLMGRDGVSEDRQSYREQTREPDPDEVEIVQIDLQYGMGGTFLDDHVEEQRMKFSRSWLRLFTDAAPVHLFWTRGMGNSMEPSIGDGEVVLIDRGQNRVEMGDLIYAFAYGDVGMMKRLRPLPDGTVEIHSDNPNIKLPPAIASDGEIHIVGRVVAVVKRL